MPDSIRPMDSSMVATGRAMKKAEKFIATLLPGFRDRADETGSGPGRYRRSADLRGAYAQTADDCRLYRAAGEPGRLPPARPRRTRRQQPGPCRPEGSGHAQPAPGSGAEGRPIDRPHVGE